MKKLIGLLFSLAVVVSTFGQTTWTIDKSHSKVGFNVIHMAVSEVEGKFNEFDGTIISKSEDFNGAEVSFAAKTTSIDTDNERRDTHLKSPDFFEAEKFPEITFKGNLLKKEGKYKLVGDFTMKGVTKKVEFDVTYGGSITTERGSKAGFKLSGSINRQEYGLSWNNKLTGGELAVSDNVELIVKIELNKKAS
jgi:polyisoprenoid-binding protein YceI